MTPRLLLDRLLDATIVLSFDRTGFARHRAGFRDADLAASLSGLTALVTGANSGIGRATARALAARGARVLLLCRREGAGEEAAAAISRETGSRNVATEALDVSDLAAVERFCRGFRRRKVDVLVNNAGVLPDVLEATPDGLERTLATNLVGPFLLTKLLLPRLAAARGRVVNVSSGGMYTQRLDVAALHDPPEKPFDGVLAYARTKRALVVATELMAQRWGAGGVSFYSMHPGWADTPAVRSSLPRFWAVTRAVLRTPEEGADTVVWLAAARPAPEPSGGFFFDRQPRPAHLLPFTREESGERERLWSALERWSAARPARAGRR